MGFPGVGSSTVIPAIMPGLTTGIFLHQVGHVEVALRFSESSRSRFGWFPSGNHPRLGVSLVSSRACPTPPYPLVHALDSACVSPGCPDDRARPEMIYPVTS